MTQGCASSTPLLHPAHVLGPGATRFATGLAQQFVMGDVATMTGREQANEQPTTGPALSENLVSEVSTTALVAGGVSPVVSARSGLGGGNEGGLTYTGRAMRLDVRHALQDDTWALSLGVGGSVLKGRDTTDEAVRQGRGYQLERMMGWAIDVPLTAGWRSQGSIVWTWWGLRGRYERMTADVVHDVDAQQTTVDDVRATAKSVGGMVGMAVGGGGVHVALELDAGWVVVDGSVGDVRGRSTGMTLSPSAALLATF